MDLIPATKPRRLSNSGYPRNDQDLAKRDPNQQRNTSGTTLAVRCVGLSVCVKRGLTAANEPGLNNCSPFASLLSE